MWVIFLLYLSLQMGRKPNESESGRWAYLTLFFMGLLSCSLVYMGLSHSFRSRILSSASLYSSSSAKGVVLGGGGEAEEENECCRGIENLELWGTAVKWGTDFKFNSSKECCRACKGMCLGDGPCLCDSWVFCGDRERCGGKFGEVSWVLISLFFFW